MPYCPHCGALVAEDATVCKNCGTSLQPQQLGAPQSSQSPQPRPSTSTPQQRAPGELSQRLEKALRRTELLSYAAIVLSVLVLIEAIYWFILP